MGATVFGVVLVAIAGVIWVKYSKVDAEVYSEQTPPRNVSEQKSDGEDSIAKALSSNAAITRFGIFQVQAGENGNLQAKISTDPVMPASGDQILEATVRGQFQVSNADLVLIEQTHGTSCPATYTLFTVTAKSVSASPEFGTCAEATEVKSSGSTIRISMPGFKGPFETADSRAAAASEHHTFIFGNGRVEERTADVNAGLVEHSRPLEDSIVGAWNCGDWTMAFFPDGTTVTRIHKADGTPEMYVAGNYHYGGNSVISHWRADRFEAAPNVPRSLNQWTPGDRTENVLESTDIYMKTQVRKIDDGSISIKELGVMNWDRKTTHDSDADAQVCKRSQVEYKSLRTTRANVPDEYLQTEDLPSDF